MEKIDCIKLFYENLKKDDLDKLDEIYDENSTFKDPFNELDKLEDIKKIFIEMFEELENPRFIFIDEIKNSKSVFYTWDFIFLKSGKEYIIHGSSHLKLNEKQKIYYHRDYWDVGEELLLKIPLVKNFYGLLKNKLAVT